MPELNGWNEWSMFVLRELERLNSCYEKLDEKIDRLDKRLTLSQIKLAGLSASVAIVVTITMALLKILI